MSPFIKHDPEEKKAELKKEEESKQEAFKKDQTTSFEKKKVFSRQSSKKSNNIFKSFYLATERNSPMMETTHPWAQSPSVLGRHLPSDLQLTN